jgi:hypothetical protein
VSTEWAEGLYNPHTMHGDIVVDGVHTSTYTDSVAPALAHALLWPVRMLVSSFPPTHSQVPMLPLHLLRCSGVHLLLNSFNSHHQLLWILWNLPTTPLSN